VSRRNAVCFFEKALTCPETLGAGLSIITPYRNSPTLAAVVNRLQFLRNRCKAACSFPLLEELDFHYSWIELASILQCEFRYATAYGTARKYFKVAAIRVLFAHVSKRKIRPIFYSIAPKKQGTGSIIRVDEFLDVFFIIVAAREAIPASRFDSRR
jgi:hypothetical protein